MLKVNDNKPIVFVATVKSTKDPKKLGRVQVELKNLDKAVEMPWIRLLQPMAGKDHGYVWLPEVGDVVAVLRGAGDRVNSMLIIGSAAGVAAMGMEKIDFIWYLKNIGWLALLGFLGGAGVFLVQQSLF